MSLISDKNTPGGVGDGPRGRQNGLQRWQQNLLIENFALIKILKKSNISTCFQVKKDLAEVTGDLLQIDLDKNCLKVLLKVFYNI